MAVTSGALWTLVELVMNPPHGVLAVLVRVICDSRCRMRWLAPASTLIPWEPATTATVDPHPCHCQRLASGPPQSPDVFPSHRSLLHSVLPLPLFPVTGHCVSTPGLLPALISRVPPGLQQLPRLPHKRALLRLSPGVRIQALTLYPRVDVHT